MQESYLQNRRLPPKRAIKAISCFMAGTYLLSGVRLGVVGKIASMAKLEFHPPSVAWPFFHKSGDRLLIGKLQLVWKGGTALPSLLHLPEEEISMRSRYATFLAVGLIWAVTGVDNAKAQYGCGYGFGLDVGRLYGVLADNVPHFAAFPPVYYSAPVPRTYGHSPFAYPPGTKTPEIVAPEPLEIINPHATGAIKASTSSSDEVTLRATTSQPLVVVNPYVTRPMLNASVLVH